MSINRRLLPFLLVAVAACTLKPFTVEAAVTFTVSPSTVSNSYVGTFSLLISNVPAGDTVVVQKYLDLNTNGVINGTDPLVQQFSLTDGQAGMIIGGVTNFNVPGDLNTATGIVTAALNFQNGDMLQNLVGKYLFRLSSPAGHFTPLTNAFTVTNFPFGQKFTGNVMSNTVAVSNAIVILMNYPQGVALGGAVANNAGSYTLQAPPGKYLLLAARSNYLANMAKAPALTLSNLATVTTNLFLTNTTASISGRMVDADNPALGLPGLLCLAQSTNGMLGIGFSDANGNFTVRVGAGRWDISPENGSLIINGYLGSSSGTNVAAGAATVTNALPKASALFYGSVKDSLGNPMPGLDIFLDDSPGFGLYRADGYTDANGNYYIGVLGGDDSWWMSVSGDTGPTNYIFSQAQLLDNGMIAVDAAVQQDFVGILATNRITGNVKFNGTNVVGVSLWAQADINGIYYQTAWQVTGTNGSFSLNVCNGSWTVGVNCNGGNNNDSLDSILGIGSYVCPNDQAAIIAGNNGTNNFVIQPCGGVIIVTTNLPAGEVGAYYDQYLQAASCDNTFTWTRFSGSLPPGVNLNTNTGELFGTPTGAGTYNFTVRATDGGGHATNQALSINILSNVQITTASLPSGTNGIAYGQSLQASGGMLPYYWELSSGSLPPNLNLDANGLLAGMPVAGGSFNFTAQVTDALGGSHSRGFSLNVIGTNSYPPLMVGTGGGQILIYWPLSAGTNYTVETTTNLSTGPWVPATNGAPVAAFVYTNQGPAVFFRLR